MICGADDNHTALRLTYTPPSSIILTSTTRQSKVSYQSISSSAQHDHKRHHIHTFHIQHELPRRTKVCACWSFHRSGHIPNVEPCQWVKRRGRRRRGYRTWVQLVKMWCSWWETMNKSCKNGEATEIGGWNDNAFIWRCLLFRWSRWSSNRES